MPKPKNASLRNDLTLVYHDLLKNHAPGDPPVLTQLAEYLQTVVPDLSYANAYQRVLYYIKDALPCDRRGAYTPAELANLSLMTPYARGKFAEETGRTLQAVDAAVRRYQRKQAHLVSIPDREYFSFSNLAHLHALKVDRDRIATARLILEDKFNLALRAPNILYHPATKRRYYMTTNEQLALIQDPAMFLRRRSAHIKDHWVTKDMDPFADPHNSYAHPSVRTPSCRAKTLTPRVVIMANMLRATRELPSPEENPSLHASITSIVKELTRLGIHPRERR